MRLLLMPKGILVEENDESVVIKNSPIYVLQRESGDTQSPTGSISYTGESLDYGVASSSFAQLYGADPYYALTFGPHGTNPLTPDYPQTNPRRFAGYGGSGYIDCSLITNSGEDKYFRLYPNKEDKSFYIRIRIYNANLTAGPDRYYIYMGFYRNNKLLFGNMNQGDDVYCSNQSLRFNIKVKTLQWISNYEEHNFLFYSWAQSIVPFRLGQDQFDPVISTSIYSYLGSGNVSDALWKQWIAGYEPAVPDGDNPYWNGGVSVEGGGNGNFSEESDTPETDSLPQVGAVGTGFATIFKPSKTQLKSLSELFWNSNVFTLLQNLVENITDMFTSLAMVPFDVIEGQTVSVTWLGIDTAVNLTLAGAQYYEFDMGSINMANDSRIFTSGSVLDYSPFSKLGIYLPFIGYQELDIDECRDAVINLRYRIDILSGACVAILKVGGRDLYQFTGNCLTQIPITNESMQSLVSDAVNVGIAAAGVGATGASVGADLAEAATSKNGIEYADIANAHRSITRAESGLASASANAVIGSKPTFNKSGAISSSSSMLAVKQPYLFLSTPRQSIPEHYQRYRGFPSNITSKLGDLSGFTVVEDIRLNGLVATSPEVAEIYDLLKKGVII